MRGTKVKNIFVHCSATPWADAIVIDEWHKANGWSGIGYHFVILNGSPHKSVEYFDFLDGQIHSGRPLDNDFYLEAEERGAQVKDRNSDSVGICLVGLKEFTDKQLVAAKLLLSRLVEQFKLKTEDVWGHCEDPNTTKTCPNIPMKEFREFLDEKIGLDELQAAIKKHIKEIYG